MRANAIIRAITNWESKGVIDAPTAARLREFEGNQPRPNFLRLVFSLGALAIGFGIITLVAANWDELSIPFKLGAHVVLNMALGYGAWRAADEKPFTREVLLLVLSISSLALIAHIGQSFQIDGTICALLGTWLVLTAPFTFALVTTPLHKVLWTIGFALFSVALFMDNGKALTFDDTDYRLINTLAWIYTAILFTAPAWIKKIPAIPSWVGDALHRLSVISLILGVSTSQMAWRFEPSTSHFFDVSRTGAIWGMVVGTLLFVAIGIMAVKRNPTLAEKAKAVFFATIPLLCTLPVLFTHGELPVVGAIFFVGIWFYIAWIAVLFQNTWLFNLAAVFIALRIFIVTLEVFGSLMSTGIGLIVAGVVFLILGWLCQRVMRWGKMQIKGSA